MAVSVAALAVYALSVRFQIFGQITEWTQEFERYQVDELLTLLLFLPGALLVFAVRRMHDLRAEIDRRQQVERQLAWYADHDPLTGVGNRRTILAALHGAPADASAGTVVLFVDLDDFKGINDALGHRVGDEVLAITAARLRGAVRPQDVVARYGGDEFLVVAHDLDAADAAGLAERAAAAFAAPFVVGGAELRVGVSVGVAHGVAGEDADTLLARADAAMYRVKRRTRAEVPRQMLGAS